MNYQVCEINRLDEFSSIKNEWNQLLSKSDCDQPFLRHEWLTIWWDHFGVENVPVIILVKNDDDIVMAAPLMEVKSPWFGFVTLKSMTNFHSNGYHILLDPRHEKAIASMYEYLASRTRRWDLLLLQDISTRVENYALFLKDAKRSGFMLKTWSSADSAFIPIAGEWDEYYKSLKSKFRSNIRNREKRLGKIGNISYEVITEPENIEPALDKGFEIEKKSWKGANKSAIAYNPVLTSFYTKIAKVAAEEKWLRLSFLKVDDNLVAFDYSLVYRDTMYCLKIGFDPEYRPFSVGQLLCKENIKRSFDDKLSEYDFLGEMTRQKSDWTNNAHKIIWIYVSNTRFFGKLYFVYKFRIKQRLKKLVNR